MAYNTKIHLIDDKVIQNSGDELNLSGTTIIDVDGLLKYSDNPTFSGDTQIVTKKYVDDKLTGGTFGTIYNLESPSTVTVGGLPAASVLTGKTSNCILKEILTPYQAPSFSSFSSGIASTVEVGCVISGNQSFSWSFGNSSNVQPATMCVIDITDGATEIATNISTSSPQTVTISTVTFTTCGQTQQWKGCATNTKSTDFGSSLSTVTSILPYYYGKCTCPGAAGDNRPVLNAADITSGTKVLAGSAGSFSINFNSGDDDYLWFAVPASVANKTCWVIDSINNGDIGGGISPACNLFPDNYVVNSVSTACWSGEAYEVYMSNKQTSTSASMTIS